MIRFQQVRNATVKLYYPGVIFMIDPWLMDACTPDERDQALAVRRFIPKPVCALPAAAEDLIADVDFFLLTHLHPDHFSADCLPLDAVIVCQNEEDALQLKEMGFTEARYFDNESLSLGGITVYRVGACHGESKDLAQRMGPCSGFVFVCEGEKTICAAGDSVYYEGIRSVINRFAPDVMIVNACDARSRTGRLIMNAEDVIKTCECRHDCIVIASHMEAVSHAHLTRAQLRETLLANGYSEQVLIPEDGEYIEI